MWAEIHRDGPVVVAHRRASGRRLGQQRQLFQLLGDVESSIGVRLTDSFLMIPNKTVSGILFPTEVPFYSCQLCTREACPRRRAEYTGVAGLTGH